MSTTVGYTYHSELFRDQILACTDVDQLDAWLRRAATATSADQVVNP